MSSDGTNGDRGVLSACGLTDEIGVAKARRVSSLTPSNDNNNNNTTIYMAP